MRVFIHWWSCAWYHVLDGELDPRRVGTLWGIGLHGHALLDTANIVCKAEALGFKFETYVGHSKPKPADNQIISQ